jgi:hypothetical protein
MLERCEEANAPVGEDKPVGLWLRDEAVSDERGNCLGFEVVDTLYIRPFDCSGTTVVDVVREVSEVDWVEPSEQNAQTPSRVAITEEFVVFAYEVVVCRLIQFVPFDRIDQ